MPTSTCLITGANGFVGRALCAYLQNQGFTVRGSIREQPTHPPVGISLYPTGGIDANTDWTEALQGVHTIVHLAGTVHRPDIQDPAVYQRSIVDATINLTKQAAAASVKRLVYVSSAHVYGVEASRDLISEQHPCHPLTPYAKAKWQAEQWLQQDTKQTTLEIVIVRPPLVYGPGVGGNFAQLIKLVKLLPILPLGCATQPRSLVGLNNLVAFLHVCMVHPQAANTTFNLSDDNDLSTRTLCEKLAKMKHKKRIFLPIPAALMHAGLKLCGKGSVYYKLFESMRLDVQLAKNKLNWQPPYSVDEQIKISVEVKK